MGSCSHLRAIISQQRAELYIFRRKPLGTTDAMYICVVSISRADQRGPEESGRIISTLTWTGKDHVDSWRRLISSLRQGFPEDCFWSFCGHGILLEMDSDGDDQQGPKGAGLCKTCKLKTSQNSEALVTSFHVSCGQVSVKTIMSLTREKTHINL